MSSFAKGITFTMGGTDYEVLADGNADPASCLVYVPSLEKETADPLSLALWKAEAKLARGDILIHGARGEAAAEDAFSPYADSLQQLAELKKRIYAIERRRISLLKIDDPAGQSLLRDNIVKPNRQFDIWSLCRSASAPKARRNIQYIKIHGLVLAISAGSTCVEHFRFDISDQFHSPCQVNDDVLTTHGRARVDLTPETRTVQGARTSVLPADFGGRIDLTVEFGASCRYASGKTIINASIQQAAYVRDVKAPGLKMNKIAFPEIGEHMLAVVGVCVEIYTEDPDNA